MQKSKEGIEQNYTLDHAPSSAASDKLSSAVDDQQSNYEYYVKEVSDLTLLDLVNISVSDF